MKAHHLLFQNSIDINPRMGTIKLNDKRMALMSVEALGLLRRDLVSTLSMERAKGFLLRYGWACGYNDAESIEKMFNWESKEELILAGPALHTLEGVVTVEPDILEINSDQFYMTGYWRNSFEAEEHIRHFGYSKESVCWMLLGYAKGYIEKTYGKEVSIYEKNCVGKRDQSCYFVIQTVEHCESEHREILRYFKEESLITELDKMYSEISRLNSAMLRSDQVQKHLTNLLLEGNNLSTLIEYISGLLERSVVIEKGSMNKDLETKFCNQTDIDRYQVWKKRNIHQPEPNIKVYPITVNKIPLGRMVVIANDPIKKVDEMIIESSLSVISIQMHIDRMIAQSLWKKKVDFFEEVIKEKFDSESLLQKASHIFEFDIKMNNRIVVIKSVSEEKNEDIRILLNSTFPTIDTFMNKGFLVMILHQDFENKEQLRDFLVSLQNLIEQSSPMIKFYIGVGRTSNSLIEIGKSYQDAFRICDFLNLSFPGRNKIALYDELDHIMLFLNAMHPNELLSFSKKILGRLIDCDETNESNLIQTLKVYLDNNSNVNQTAKELNLSIPGLRYRLEKIQTLCDEDLKSGIGCFHCQLAIQIYYSLIVIEGNSNN
ncbi:XylR N-terminal domain-containing protein [Bacillus sp. JJ1562]|uniref:XylR N-terminal domain-containing protein n=1 Tax=Bacillus sp. JJ1562 TaxID=3122960 RepID=UPI00300150E7